MKPQPFSKPNKAQAPKASTVQNPKITQHEVKAEQEPDTPPKPPTREELFESCKELASAPNLLSVFEEELRRCGVVGSVDYFHILLLTMITRLSKTPVSIVIKGSATAGKSFTLDTVLRYTPSDAYEFYSGMSEKAIIYSKRSLRHKMLCIGEYAGLQSDKGNQWIRQLLTDGRIVYNVTGEDNGEGRESYEIIKEGPTGLIVTTTAMDLYHEDETRVISLHIQDSAEQTAAVLRAQALKAQGIAGAEPNTAPWITLHEWIAAGNTQVEAPFFLDLAERVDPTKGRMRRDFPKVLEMVKAHALLHQANRQTNEAGAVIATLADYDAVYALLATPLAEGHTDKLEPGVNDIVAAVSVLSSHPEHHAGVPQNAIVAYLAGEGAVAQVDKSTVSRRVQKALAQGYLAAPSAKPGSGQKLQIGHPRGTVRQVLPHPDTLRRTTKG